MTHTIAELERQYEQAVQNKKTAIDQLRSASKRLFEARVEQYTANLADRGIVVGSKVCVNGKMGGFAGFEPGCYRTDMPSAKFTKLKKDGTAGRQKVHIYTPSVDSIELCQ